MSTTPQTRNSQPVRERREQTADRFRGRPAVGADAPTTVVSGIARYKLWILLLAVVLAGIGVAVGLARQPVYTASSTLQVGQANPNSPGFSGFAQSASDLATDYSRAITASGVLNRVQTTTGLPPSVAASRLSAEPIPNSNVFRIIATGRSARAAIRLANETASAMVAYEATANAVGGGSALYKAYQHQALVVARDSATVSRLSANSLPGNTSPALIRAQGALSADRMRASALSAAYAQTVAAQPASNLITPLAGAFTATGDRSKKIELYGFIGLIGGFVIGSLIAVLVEQRRVRPRLS